MSGSNVEGLWGGRWLAVITAVLAGSAIGLLAAGGVVPVAVLVALMRHERFAWERAATAPLTQT
jgi:hypothetical protein